jgi:hypothetical protein
VILSTHLQEIGTTWLRHCGGHESLKPQPAFDDANGVRRLFLGFRRIFNQKTLLFPQHNLIGRRHAWKRRAAVGRVQLHQSRAASSAGPSTAFAAGMTDEALQQLQPRFNRLYAKVATALDCAGEVVASAPAVNAVLGAQRTNVNGTARLQPAVPLVRGLEHG